MTARARHDAYLPNADTRHVVKLAAKSLCLHTDFLGIITEGPFRCNRRFSLRGEQLKRQD
jgi:hypothetical protein